jgi:allantoin racemase
MRLFYQSLGVSRRSTQGGYAAVLRAMVAGSAATGTEISIAGLGPNRAIADQYAYLELVDSLEVVENGLKAAREGYDAILIGNIFEPGLHQLRELLDIPVLGLRECTVHMACLMGPSFSLINVNPKFVHPILRGIAAQGLASRMVSVEHMDVERAGVFDLALEDEAQRAQVVAQFRAAAETALAKGAEVLVPAGGSLMAVLEAAGVVDVQGAPVLNGTRALVKMGEMAVSMRQLTGRFTAKSMVYAPPKGQLLHDARAAYGEEIYPGAQ